MNYERMRADVKALALYLIATLFSSSLVLLPAPAVADVRGTPSVETGTYGVATYTDCSNSVSSINFSKSVSASSTLLVVHAAVAVVTAVTYNGVSLTKATSSAAASTWYLVNPPSGTHDISVSYDHPQGSL